MPKFFKRIAATVLLINAACAPLTGSAELSERSVGDRRYLLVDPPQVNGAAPLVIALHGAFGSADRFQNQLSMDAVAAQMGFRVAYLEGTGAGIRGKRARTWNAGNCCGAAQRKGVNDIVYINGVIAQLRSEGKVSSINMVGHSNGAMMTYRYLCQSGAAVSSAVIMAGSKLVSGCNLAARTRVLVLHGAQDDNVPINGGFGDGPSGANYASLQNSVSGLTAAGASVSQEIVSAGHSVRQLNGATGGNLPTYVARFMFGQ